ncbi:hypothetical protein BCV72DRAFT_53565 [Rhizopus microsporus var. microsporus]|uniref:Uncharacterized protein n=1 Tax=Rhizopus microsporus var. microsporus TaxID=86635 RepID=A0A1X0QRL6_RHIZD|nr:hypothetical protein BCV72DRAFT_53565 [Rhizopus microsporus var. microsporus]
MLVCLSIREKDIQNRKRTFSHSSSLFLPFISIPWSDLFILLCYFDVMGDRTIH